LEIKNALKSTFINSRALIYLNRSYTYIVSFFFLHPDCTVGSGITPDHAIARGLTLPPKTSKRLPPVGNYTLP